MKAALTILALILLPVTVSSAQQAVVRDSDRFFDLATYILNEPCLIYDEIPYAAQFLLDDRAELGFYWSLIGGEEIVEPADGCESLLPGVLTNSPDILSLDYTINQLIISDGNIDTSLRYEIASHADVNQLDSGFSFDRIRELREGEIVIVSGNGAVSFPGPTSIPFEWGAWIGTSYSFSGSFSYDGNGNTFTVELDGSNEAGTYPLTVIFREPPPGLLELKIVYPIEFHVI